MYMTLKKMLKQLASLRLAVVVLISIGAISSIGTIVESKYDAMAAQKLVYDTWYMYAILSMLAVNLIAVMIDRWPWQRKHTPFILAHIGILFLLIGGIVTKKYGLDGSMAIPIGEKSRYVMVSHTMVTVFTSFDAQRYSKTFEQEVDFFLKPPTKEKPLAIPLMDGELKIIDYMPYALGSSRFIESQNKMHGSAVRFQISNENVNSTQWLFQRNPHDVTSQKMGLAEFILGSAPTGGETRNAIYFYTTTKQGPTYTITYRDPQKKSKTASYKEGDEIDTGWMNLKIKILRYLPLAQETWDFKKSERPTEMTVQAIQVEYQGKTYWTQLNDVLKFFGEQSVYIFSFGNKRIDLGFDIEMKKFEVGRYQGTSRAMSYQSEVHVNGVGDQIISMNEPLKHAGLTFYQASFQSDPGTGEPTASILSVNYDPGRWLKYIGSLIMTLGVVSLFYFKKYYVKKKEG